MKVFSYKISILFILFLLSACGKSSLVPRDYAGWIENEENGLRKIKDIGNYKITLQYRPLEYMVVMEKQKDRLSSTEVIERINDLKDFQYYHLRLSSSDPQVNVMNIGNESEADYYAKLNYFSFAMQDDIFLLQGEDTLKCKLFQGERTYELTPFLDFTMAFEKGKDSNSDKEFVFDGNSLGIGPVRFLISQESILNTPTLITY